MTTMTRLAAGMIRRARRRVEGRSEVRPVAARSLNRTPVITNPEMTKKTSTPTIAAPQPGDVGVKEDDQQDGHRPEPLDVGTESAVTRCGSGLVAGGSGAVGRDRHHANGDVRGPRTGPATCHFMPPTTAGA